MRHLPGIAAAAVLISSVSPIATQDELVATTKHQATIEGTVLHYTATVGRIPIRPMDSDEPHAHMSYVAYRVASTAGTPRPLTFMWGGGPSSSGMGTHMSFGPKRVEKGELVDNQLTLLTVSDLVFVDPVGTGFSRPVKREYADEFYNVLGDQASFAEFIRVWRARYDAANAPIFLYGVSYGCWRVSAVTEMLEKSGMRVAGGIQNSGGLHFGYDAAPREVFKANRTPGRAAAAFHHGLIPADISTTREAVVKAAEKWAADVYAPALMRIDKLTDAERESVARDLSRFTGFPLAKIDRKTLYFGPRTYLNDGFLPGRNVNNFDMRQINAAPGGTGGGRGGANVDALRQARYLRDELGYRTDLAYLGTEAGYTPVPGPPTRTPTSPVPWNYNTTTITPQMRAELEEGEGPPGTDAWNKRAAKLNPQLRFLIGAGLYDALNSCTNNEELLRRNPDIAPQFVLKCYLGGHGFRDPVTAPQFAADLRAFIKNTLAERQSRPTGEPVGTIEHVWKPVRDGGAEVTAIEVRTEIRKLPASAAQSFTLNAPITYAGVPGIVERTQKLEARDASGPMAFRIVDDAPHPGGFPHYRHWRAERDVKFPVRFSYRAVAPSQPVGGPPFGLLANSGGVSGAGSGFLVLPEGKFSVTSRVRWDLTDLAKGSSAATTFGEGDFELRGSPDQLRQGWIMAGPLGRYPERGDANGFVGVWLGTPEWDPVTEMQWAATMYAYLGRAYAYLNPLPPYKVFIRVGGRGGTALANSFMGGAQPRPAGAAPRGQASRGTFTHEMGHMFVGGIDAPMGVSSWFSEGLNTYYTRLLQMRGGFTSVEEYGRDLNRAFQGYYTNSARNMSADAIVEVGFNDSNIRHIPYVRGSLYFADLDSKIRAHSGGTRNLDKVLFELFQRRERGEPFNHDVWMSIVTKEAGPAARDDFDAIIIKGTKTLVPASDAFGPCFARQDVPASIVDGKERPASYEWVRAPSIPDEKCREPWLAPQAAGQAQVTSTREPVVAVTEHAGTFNGQTVKYTATVAETIIPGADGKPAAVMINTAYVRQDVKNRSARPVMFVFNGGPGASSSPLHFSAFGPRRRGGPGDSLRDNPYSPLDAVDLVFIDPIGTGFSRPLPGIDGQPFWSISGDAASVKTFIQGWLKANGREASPRFLCGESYGTVRAGEIVSAHRDLAFDGVLLFSLVARPAGPEMPFVVTLPTFAVAAAYHGKVDPAGRSVSTIFEEAATFARTDYIGALIQGDALPAAEKTRIAQELSKRIGLPADFIASKNLRIGKPDFMMNLLKDRGVRTGQLDTRATGEFATYATRQPPYDDPSMGRGSAPTPSQPAGQNPSPPQAPAPSGGKALQNYFTTELKFPTSEAYRGLNLEINAKWKFDVDGAMADPVGRIGAVMKERPRMRMFWAAGFYDLSTPLYAGKYVIDHSGIAPNRVTLAMFPTGHSVFDGDDNLSRFSEAVRRFVAAGPQPEKALRVRQKRGAYEFDDFASVFAARRSDDARRGGRALSGNNLRPGYGYRLSHRDD